MKSGFIRVASAAPQHKVADVDFNVREILAVVHELEKEAVDICVFPELSITGYTCGDLFHSSRLIDAAEAGLEAIRKASESVSVAIIVGLPRRAGSSLMNSAAIVQSGHVEFVDKIYLPNYNEFYEKRWFASGVPSDRIFECKGVKIGVELCEDLWSPIPPSSLLALKGAEVIFNLSASDDHIGKYNYLLSLISQQSARCLSGYVYSSAGGGESTTDLVFLPKTIVAENGTILAQNDRKDFLSDNIVIADIDIEAVRHDRIHNTTFHDCAVNNGVIPDSSIGRVTYDVRELPKFRYVDPQPFVPPTDALMAQRCEEILTIQEAGLSSRLLAIGNPKIVVGISGGLDSTQALLVATLSMKRLNRPMTDIIAVTMPGFGTTNRTYDNAMTLMKRLGVTIREIPISQAVMQHFEDIGHNPDSHDVTYENSQARERTQILMDIANQVGGIVLGTGDLSELALGWATYNGDHMSMYGVNASVPKTLIKYLVRHFANDVDDAELRKALLDVIDTPISPELTPADSEGNIAQKTESFVGPYELNDFFLYYMLRYGYTPAKTVILARKAFAGVYDDAEILKWLKLFYRRFFSQQFKRSCLPDGPKVGSVCLSPRGDWRMPSDASSRLWIDEVEEIERMLLN